MRSPPPFVVMLFLVTFVGTVWGDVRTKPTPPPSAPYQRQSLAGLSDEELLRRMGPGRKAYEFEYASIIQSHVPDGFWKMKPSRAAIALLEVNLSEQDRGRYRFEIEEHRGAQPPEAGSLAVTYNSSRCYNAIDRYYFLRFDPAGSYLAYAGLSAGGVVFYSAVHDQPAFDLRICPLSYADARQLAATLWSLDRVRNPQGERDAPWSMTMSTADGFGAITLKGADGDILFERRERRWAAQLSERWRGRINDEVFVNFASYLMTKALPKHLGKAWVDAAASEDQPAFLRRDRGPRYNEAELARIEQLTLRILADFSPGQERISYPIVAAAAEAAGTLLLPDAEPLLGQIRTALPEPRPMRRFEDVSNELHTLRTADADTAKKRAERKGKISALEAEQTAILRESGSDGARYLHGVVTSSLRKLAIADDVEALHALAIAREADSQWALQRLSRVDAARYVDALESCMSREEPRWARQYFEEIVRVDPERAKAIAAALPPDQANALTVSAFAVLHRANELADEGERVTALLAVLQNPKSGWDQRGQAIDLLVPPEEPLRYPQPEVDQALLRVLEPDQADDVVNFTQAAACRALALRRRTETFELMAGLLAANRDPFLYGRILDAMAQLAQADPGRLNPRLLRIVTPELAATNKRMDEIMWVIWTADLRSLRPTLEQLGTSGPDDYEDAKASSCGGDVTPVKGRFHLARQIADTWNATDPVTEIRLLTALGLEMAYFLTNEPDMSRLYRFRTSLRAAAQSLTPEQRERLETFFQVVLAQPERDDTANAAQRRQIVDLVKQTIAAPASK